MTTKMNDHKMKMENVLGKARMMEEEKKNVTK